MQFIRLSIPALEELLDTEQTYLSNAQNRGGSRLFSEVLFSSGGRMLGRGLNFLSQLAIARELGPESFGVFAIGWNILRLLIIAGPLGLEQGAIRYGSKYWKQSPEKLKGILLTSSLISLASGILIGVLLSTFTHALAYDIFKKPDLEPVFGWLSFILPLSILLHVLAAATTVSQNIKYSVVLEEIGQPALQIAIWISLLALKKGDLESAMLSIFLSYLVPTVLAVIVTVRIFPEIIHSRANYSFLNLDLFLFTIPTSLAVLFGSLISWGDRLIVGYFRSEAETGIYQAISLVSIVFTTLLSGIKVVVGPAVARLFSQGDHKRIEDIYTISTRWGLFIGIGLFATIVVLGRELLGLGYGQAYASGFEPLVILAFAQVINLGTGPLDMILIMMGRQNDWLRITLLTLFVSLLAAILLTPRFGLLGTAVSTSITVIVTFILGYIKLRRILQVKPYNMQSMMAIIGGVLACGAGLLFKVTFPQLNIWLLVLFTATIVMIIYGAWISKFILTTQDKLLFAGVISSLNKHFSSKAQ